MRMKTKKALYSYFFGILIFFLISIVGIIISYLYFAIGNDYIVLPLYNSSTQYNTTAQITAGFENTVSNYQNTNLGFIDDFWFFSYLAISIFGFVGAYTTRGMNYFSFISMLTYGLMIILFVAGLFYVVINWLYNDILLNLFVNLAVNLPKFDFIIRNFGIIFMLQASAMLLVNVVDFDFSSIINRKKKESQALNDDEII